jgi:hypothetical protein
MNSANDAQPMPPAARVALIVAAVFWLVGIAYGINQFQHFESTPGETGLTPALWPATSTIRPHLGQATLVMLVHPQCSCTSASLSELGSIMNQYAGRVSAYVLFIQPAGTQVGWEKTSTWNQAQQIPGVTVQMDPNGAEAARFGALTSGHTVLYDSAGELQFSGGITSARGHVGDNVGRELLLTHLNASSAVHRQHAVFGCPLTDLPIVVEQP